VLNRLFGIWRGGVRVGLDGSGLRTLRRVRSSQPYMAFIAVVPKPEDVAGLTLLAPEEALRQARPLPSDGELAIEGLTDVGWEALEKAPAER
jgi:hypothetical protein